MWLILFQDRGGAFLYSFLVGAFIGLLYDLFRVSRVLLGRGRLKVFFEDLVFCLMSAVVLCVFVFNTTMGMVRLFAFCGVAVGFFLYYFTLGRLTVGLARVVKRAVSPCVLRFKRRVKLLMALFSEKRRSWSLCRRLKKEAERGFCPEL